MLGFVRDQAEVAYVEPNLVVNFDFAMEGECTHQSFKKMILYTTWGLERTTMRENKYEKFYSYDPDYGECQCICITQ